MMNDWHYEFRRFVRNPVWRLWVEQGRYRLSKLPICSAQNLWYGRFVMRTAAMLNVIEDWREQKAA